MKFLSAALALGLVSTLSAQATVTLSIGIRETEVGGGSFNGIGGNGGAGGGIEWVNLDGQTLVLDGTWQPFFFDLANDTATAFAGSSANGTLEGTFGTLEHIRILNDGGITDPISIWIDDIENTVTPAGGSATTTVFGDFEGFFEGDEVIFQEPDFSGSTAGNVVPGTFSGINSSTAFSGTSSGRADIQFIDTTPTRWCRLTTFGTPNIPNPNIRLDDNSIILFWARGLTCQAASFGLDLSCPEGLHSGNGPTMEFVGTPTLGNTFILESNNLLGSLTALLIGTPFPTPADLSVIGGIPGALLCVNSFIDVPFAGATTASVPLPLGSDPSSCGLGLTAQWLDLDPTSTAGLPFGTSASASFIVGL